MIVKLRPVGRGAWRPLVLEVRKYPRRQGVLFRRLDADLDLVKLGDTWVIDGREWRVAEIQP